MHTQSTRIHLQRKPVMKDDNDDDDDADDDVDDDEDDDDADDEAYDDDDDDADDDDDDEDFNVAADAAIIAAVEIVNMCICTSLPLLLLMLLYLILLSSAATTADVVTSDTYGTCVINVVATIDITPADKSGCSEFFCQSRANHYAYLHINTHSTHTYTHAKQASDERRQRL